MSMMLKQRMEAMKEIIEADTDPMKEVLCLGASFTPTQQIMLSNLVQGGKPWRRSLQLIYEGGAIPQGNILPKVGNHEVNWGWLHKGGATLQGNICSHSHSTNYVAMMDATLDQISEKQHIHPEDATWDQMQSLICTLCQSEKSNTSPLRMQLKIKCRDLSVCCANQ